MSVQGVKLKTIADAIRLKAGTTSVIPANTFAERILALPVGVENPDIVLPAASTQKEHFTRIAAAIRAKENSSDTIPAKDFAKRIEALETIDKNLEWVQTTLPTGVKHYYKDIAYGSGRFVVVGGYSTSGGGKSMLHSKDGINWTVATIDDAYVLYSVVYGEGKRFVAVGYVKSTSNLPLIMTNGTGAQTWQMRNNPDGVTSGKWWTSVAYGNERYVVISNGKDSAYSADGYSWTLSTMPSSAYWTDIAYGNGKFVAVQGASLESSTTGNNSAAYSFDGITWFTSSLPFSANWRAVAYGAGKFIAVCNGSNRAAYSADGVSWKEIELPLSSLTLPQFREITYGAGMFVVVEYASNMSIYSRDGISWKVAELPRIDNWNSVAYGGNKFVSVSNGGSYSAYAIY